MDKPLGRVILSRLVLFFSWIVGFGDSSKGGRRGERRQLFRRRGFLQIFPLRRLRELSVYLHLSIEL
ncbi:MAG: hypothetical protein PVH12_01460 [Candidatus Bathyarchaeota archaeon]